MKTRFTTLLTLIITCSMHAQDTLQLSDFEILNNTNWKGQLTYKDYQSGKQTSIDATMQIEIKDDKIVSTMQYTYEPHKNNRSSVKIKKKGTYFGNEKVINNRLENGVRTFVTMYQGKDNGKKATMYITRVFFEDSYTVTKEVQYLNTEERFVRNRYQFNKI